MQVNPHDPSSAELTALDLHAAGDLLRRRRLSPVELTRACLERIAQLDPALNAFITVTTESALDAARTAEAEIHQGRWRGPLHGIPVALKDLIDVAGVPTTAASRLFQDHVAAADAEVVRRLKQAGAVLLGKTNLHECAYGGSSLVSHYGAVRNPLDPARIAGGSSGGSAAAVAAGLCYAALGTDTAGSIREPAAFCGVVGLKPTYGLVSTRGVLPLSWSLDHVGPITRNVRDAALLLQAIAGYDAHDPASRECPPVDYLGALDTPGSRRASDPSCQAELSGCRVGVARDFFFSDLEPEIARCVEDALALLAKLGVTLRDIAVPVNTDRTVQTAEAYAVHESHLTAHAGLYEPETLRRIQSATTITASAYIAARRELDQLRRSALSVFEDTDLVVTPATPVTPPRINDLLAEPGQLRRRELLMLRNTRPFDVLGWPAISVPCGFTQAGLPVGLQIAGPPGGEAAVLRLANAFEQARRNANP